MTKDEMVYALGSVDAFCDVMKQEVMLYEDKGLWNRLTMEKCVLGALENLKEILDTDNPIERIRSATHAAMYCFFLLDNEAEKILDEEDEQVSFFSLLDEFFKSAE